MLLSLYFPPPFSLMTTMQLGLGTNEQCYYLIVHYPHGDKIRKQLKLPSKDLHITVGFMQSDKPDIKKGLSTLVQEHPDIIPNLTRHKSVDVLKYISMLETLQQRSPCSRVAFMLAKQVRSHSAFFKHNSCIYLLIV